MPRKRKITKRANSTGCIYKLKGTRRKPYAVKVTIDRDTDTGKPIRKNIGYFETYSDAKDFLDMYNLMKRKDARNSLTDEQAKAIDVSLYEKVKAVQALETTQLTFKDIFNIIYEDKYKYLSSSSQHLKKVYFNKFKPLHDRNINTITLFDLQRCVDEVKSTVNNITSLSNMKSIASNIFEYAVIHQYITRDKDFTSYIDISFKEKKEKKEKHIPFSIEEIRTLFNYDNEISRMILINIFTGCRPIELLSIDTSNIYLDVVNNDDGYNKVISYIITGSKTEAGKNRIIPIHDAIKPLIITQLNNHNDYLMIKKDNNDLSRKYRELFVSYMQSLNMKHLPYDCRHTFSTLARLNGVDEFCHKKIMGHKTNDITKDVYTHEIINKLFDEINKIKV